MAREVETLKSKLPQKVNSIASQEIFEICEICWVMGHVTKGCPTLPAFREMLHDQANFVNQFKKPSTFSETYNSRWRNHTNFKWRNNTNNNVPQQKSISFYFQLLLNHLSQLFFHCERVVTAFTYSCLFSFKEEEGVVTSNCACGLGWT